MPPSVPQFAQRLWQLTLYFRALSSDSQILDHRPHQRQMEYSKSTPLTPQYQRQNHQEQSDHKGEGGRTVTLLRLYMIVNVVADTAHWNFDFFRHKSPSAFSPMTGFHTFFPLVLFLLQCLAQGDNKKHLADYTMRARCQSSYRQNLARSRW
jgi:hypothetical protein